MPAMRRVTWVGGPQDGALVEVRSDITWVTVLENNAHPSLGPSPERSLVRYTVPIIDGKIMWGQRKVAPAEASDL